MIIKELSEYLTKDIRGVFHIGAHHAEEKNWYQQNNIKNVVWFEANPQYESIIKSKVGGDPVIISALGNENKMVNFNLANNGQSSSVLNFGTHSKHHPEVRYVNQFQVKMSRMVDLVKQYNLSIDDYNFINIGIQGYELEAFKGFENLLEKFDYIYTEVNTGNVYEGCATLDELDSYLSNFNFVRVTQHITPFEWGDALYVKNN
jgi:FkbM family methyltransferase